MKKEIALIYGGDSSEYEVSIKSGKHIAQHIDREQFNVWEVLIRGQEWSVVEGPYGLSGNTLPIDKSNFSFVIPNESGIGGRRISFDKVLIMVHGTPGEDGLLQSYFQIMGIPFTTCSAEVALLTFNKYACKCFLRDMGVKMAKEFYLNKNMLYDTQDIIKRLRLPLFVKPNSGGSSFGITKVKSEEELLPAIEAAFTQDSSILIEEFIDGEEMTNGVYQYMGSTVALPVTQIISHNEFFDYEAKYLGASNEICPAPISKELSGRIVETSHAIYHYLGCSGVVRVDYIVKNNEIYFLEINTVPGMTEMSLIPQQIRAAGLSIKEFLNHLLV